MDTYEIEIDGKTLTFLIELEQDDLAEAPWEDCGHGDVTEWTKRPKAPGEMILTEDRHGWRRYYDYAGACKTARRDGWGAEGATAKERAHNAALADFEYLRRWCNDLWYYAIVTVTLLDANGNKTRHTDTLCRVESEYAREEAKRMADDIACAVTKWDNLENAA